MVQPILKPACHDAGFGSLAFFLIMGLCRFTGFFFDVVQLFLCLFRGVIGFICPFAILLIFVVVRVALHQNRSLSVLALIIPACHGTKQPVFICTEWGKVKRLRILSGGEQKLTLPKDETSKIEVSTEYGTLRRVILCPPRYMAIEEAINEVQKQYENENIDRERAMDQYRTFRDTLRAHGAEVIELEPSEEYPEQVFTRDIGFTVGEELFISRMASDIRQGEEEALEKLLCEKGIRYRKLDGGKIEGGDVIVDRDTVYVGVSERTSRDAILMLTKELPKHDIVPIEFDGKYLHLDCVFNILSPGTALIFPEALHPATVEKLGEKYNLIEVSADEQFTMGTNVLSIGGRKLFSLPVNPEVNHAMRDHGYEVIEIDFTEIIKSGGSFRCCSMPVERG